MRERQHGFYWIKFQGSKTIAEWVHGSDGTDYWLLIGDPLTYYDGELEIIPYNIDNSVIKTKINTKLKFYKKLTNKIQEVIDGKLELDDWTKSCFIKIGFMERDLKKLEDN